MTSNSLLVSLAAVSLGSALAAQIPSPSPQPRLQPRAEWTLTQGVNTPPPNRHWSPATSSDTTLYVFGGRTGTSGTGTKRNDLWAFDVTSLTWTQLSADGASAAPVQRYRNTLTYDPLNNQLIVFGGEDSNANVLGDTWVYDLTQGNWSQITTGTAPSARRFSQAAWDPSTSSVLLFGGQNAAGAELGDTWLYSNGAWVPVSGGPGARANHSLVTRPDFGDVFLCGGNDLATTGRTHYLDTWVWNAGNGGWVQIVPSTPAVPHGHSGNSTAYDPLRKRVILQGGQGISTNAGATGGAYGTQYGGSPSNWTSEFDCVSNRWLLYGGASFGGTDPVLGRASRYYMAFLEAGQKVYLWGGQDPTGRSRLTSMKEYQANPVAGTAVVGAGCAGATGSTVNLVAGDNPWLGRAFVSQTTGLATGGLAFGVIGQPAPSTPLSSLIPWGLPSCTLESTLDLPLGVVNNGGTAEFRLPLPNDLSLAGVVVRHQTLQFEVGAQISLSSSNALELVLGAL